MCLPLLLDILRHGVRQRLSCWFDGPSYITQCPIQAGQTFTYEFTLVKQKGTFFWHAHVSWLRATLYGAFVVYPKPGVPYPFKYPYQEHILLLGTYISIYINDYHLFFAVHSSYTLLRELKSCFQNTILKEVYAECARASA